MLISFRDFINESFSIDGDRLVIRYGEKSDTNKITFGKGKLKPYLKKLDGIDVQVQSLYTFKDQAGTVLMKMLKDKKIDSETYDLFLRRSAVFASRVIREQKIDVLVLIGSSSNLGRDFAHKILDVNAGIKLAPANFVKAKSAEEIKIDYDHPKISPSIIKSLESALRRAQREGVLKMKWILPANRKFLKNVFAYEGNANIFLDKNVLLVDDIVTSGSSILSPFKTAQEAGAKSVSCLTLFKSAT
jgi:hypothetical protein